MLASVDGKIDGVYMSAPKGTLGWDSKYIEKKKCPKAHVIDVLTG